MHKPAFLGRSSFEPPLLGMRRLCPRAFVMDPAVAPRAKAMEGLGEMRPPPVPVKRKAAVPAPQACGERARVLLLLLSGFAPSLRGLKPSPGLVPCKEKHGCCFHGVWLVLARGWGSCFFPSVRRDQANALPDLKISLTIFISPVVSPGFFSRVSRSLLPGIDANASIVCVRISN